MRTCASQLKKKSVEIAQQGDDQSLDEELLTECLNMLDERIQRDK